MALPFAIRTWTLLDNWKPIVEVACMAIFVGQGSQMSMFTTTAESVMKEISIFVRNVLQAERFVTINLTNLSKKR